MTGGLASIARPGGGLAMVAIDQRESLRSMFYRRTDGPVADETLVDFKLAVAERLAAHASAMLFDAQFGLDAIEAARRSSGCGVILASDRFVHNGDGLVVETDLDEAIPSELVRSIGAIGLKLLVLWRGHENSTRCLDLASRFVERCRRWGVIAIVEAIVRRPADEISASWDREAAIVEAAAVLSGVRPDLYKAEVPLYGRGSGAEIQAWAERVSIACTCPWVVLSTGVNVDDFPHALSAACRGGASGFLAGRAIWADAIGPDYRGHLGRVAVPRLQELARITDSEARPWFRAGLSDKPSSA